MVLLGTEDPVHHVGCSDVWEVIRPVLTTSHPTRERPGQTYMNTHTQQHTRKAEDATCTTVYQSVWNNHTSLLFSVRPHFPSALLTGSVHIYRSNSHIFVSNFYTYTLMWSQFPLNCFTFISKGRRSYPTGSHLSEWCSGFSSWPPSSATTRSLGSSSHRSRSACETAPFHLEQKTTKVHPQSLPTTNWNHFWAASWMLMILRLFKPSLTGAAHCCYRSNIRW